MGPHISKVLYGITYHLPLVGDPRATPLNKKVARRIFVGKSVACGSTYPSVVGEDLDGLEWYIWVHTPKCDRCKARWAEQLVNLGPDAKLNVKDAKLYGYECSI